MSERYAICGLPGLLLTLCVLFALVPGRGLWIIDPDAAAYVGLARSLAAGDGYTLAGIPHAKFPPGFPLILSLAVRLARDPQAYGLMRDLVALAGLLSVGLCYPLARLLLGLRPRGALLLCVAASTSIFLLQYCVAFLRSETWFTAFLLASLLSGEIWRRDGGLRRAALTGILAGAAIFTRTAGVVLVPALLIARLIDLHPCALRLRRGVLAEVLLFAAAAAVLPGAFAARNGSLPPAQRSSGYLDELLAPYALDLTKNVDLGAERIHPCGPEMAARVTNNLAVLALSLGKFLTNNQKGANLAVDPRSDPDHLRMRPGGYLLLFLLAVGLLGAARDNRVLLVAFALAYIALYLIWPFNQQQRFYMPIQPLLLYLLLRGCQPPWAVAAGLAAAPAGRALLGVLLVIPPVALAFGHSDQPTLFGRYSAEYFIMLCGAAGVAAIALLATVVLRGRRLDAVRVATAGARYGSVMIVAGLTLGVVPCVRSLIAEHARFVAERHEHPVAPRFAKLIAAPELVEIFQILLDRARPGDLVMSDIPKIIHVATGLDTTPARVNTRTGEVFLDAGDGRRARFVYISRELPQVFAAFRAHEDLFDVLHEIALTEGDVTIPIRLYEVRDQR